MAPLPWCSIECVVVSTVHVALEGWQGPWRVGLVVVAGDSVE